MLGSVDDSLSVISTDIPSTVTAGLCLASGGVYLTLQFRAMFHGQHDGLGQLDIQLFDGGHDAGVSSDVIGDQIVDGVHHIRPRAVQHTGVLSGATSVLHKHKYKHKHNYRNTLQLYLIKYLIKFMGKAGPCCVNSPNDTLTVFKDSLRHLSVLTCRLTAGHSCSSCSRASPEYVACHYSSDSSSFSVDGVDSCPSNGRRTTYQFH